MAKVNSLLSERLKNKKSSPKMTALAERSASGNLTSFSGVFGISELNSSEKNTLQELLEAYANEHNHISADLLTLESITSEVKAINNQAALLHGERIKRAQDVLKKYREGAFSAWLLAAYGNRQTPYNFLHYFRFWNQLPHHLRKKAESMPRQAIYSLASREGEKVQKEQIVKNYDGETKSALMSMIRECFPLNEKDKRKINPCEDLLKRLCQIHTSLNTKKIKMTSQQKKTFIRLLDEIRSSLN
ncbi:Virulence plasmid protein pGP6-D-related protein [Chlamydiales bacterium SCGC AG-110-M15]|nr:Virulence plasmid protein pGP6-D-related protein [Chlamydiales bacterium SCGC AG-110-M15]